MKPLKTILQFNQTYLILLIVVVVCALIRCKLDHSMLNPTCNQFKGYITNIKKSETNILIEFQTKETIIINLKITDQPFKLSLGQYLTVQGVLTIPNANSNFNLFNYRKYLNSKGIFYQINNPKLIKLNHRPVFKYTIKQHLINYINSFKYSRNYLKAFILGDTGDLSDDVIMSYRLNGTNHLLAISGMHISVLTMALLFILKKLFKPIKYIILFLFLWFYLFITNFSPSVSRASLFFLLLFLNKELKWHLKTWWCLVLVICIVLLTNYQLINNMAFQLSAITSMSLVISAKYLKVKSKVHQLSLVSLIAFMASMPIIINNNFNINLLSPFINLIFVPMITIIIYPLALLTFFLPFLDHLFFFITSISDQLSIIISQIKFLSLTMAKMNMVGIFFYYLLIILIIRKPNKIKIMFLGMIMIIHHNIICFYPYPRLIIIDVKQGDSMMVIYPYGKSVLIDTGGVLPYNNTKGQIAKETLIPLFRSLGVNHIDYLVLTHGDDDHMGEAQTLIKNYKVRHIIMNGNSYSDIEQSLVNFLERNDIKFTKVRDYDQIKIGQYQIHLFSGLAHNDDENDNSIISYFSINQSKILAMGDAPINTEQALINQYKIDSINYLKVGHHGSKTSTSETFLNTIKPKMAFISVKKENRYNHPSPEVIERLNHYHIKTYLTSINGSIKLIFKPNNVSITTCGT